MTVFPEVYLPELSTLSLHQFDNYSSGFPTLALVPVAVSVYESPLYSMTFCSLLIVSPVLGQWLALCPPLSYESKKRC